MHYFIKNLFYIYNEKSAITEWRILVDLRYRGCKNYKVDSKAKILISQLNLLHHSPPLF